MNSIVLVEFSWCGDGFTREQLPVGEVRDFGTWTEGGRAARLIGPVPSSIDTPPEPESEPVVAVDEPVATPVAAEPVQAPRRGRPAKAR